MNERVGKVSGLAAATAREPWLTKRELAASLKVSPRTIERLQPPCMRVGGQNRYLLSAVEAHLKDVSPQGANVFKFPSAKNGTAA